ncbi:MAG TPA: RIP metalloprotease RseP [Candidatus Bathyarchaeia archaeon]|nr:RIP metalloprotease RseP [Candidatus Bathyarchaeia archaeon]
MFLTIFVTLITLSVLILVHELGHFLAAKKGGIKVEEFGVGYPPRIWGKKVGKTVYSINWVPFGGFVRLYGEEEINEGKKEGAFWAQSKKVRLLVILAGVFANLLLSFSLFSLIYYLSGIPTETDKVIVEAVAKDSPAAAAGIKPEDVIIASERQTITSIDDFISKIETKKGEEISLELSRNGENLKLTVVPRKDEVEGQGPLGVIVSNYQMIKYPFWQMPVRSMIEGGKETYSWTIMIVGELVKMIKNLLLAGQVPRDIAGPIGIFQVTSQVAKSGIVPILQFIGILSINLAVINIFPFPALDGGQFFFLVIEALIGRRSPRKLEKWAQAVGMAFLLFLMLLVTVNDIRRILLTTQFGSRLRNFLQFL